MWSKLSNEFKKTAGDKYKLLVLVLNSVSNEISISAGDIKLAAMLWAYCIQQRKLSDVLAIKMKKKHCLIQ